MAATTVDTLLVRVEADLSSLRRQLKQAQTQTSTSSAKMRQSFSKVGDSARNLSSQFSLLKTAVAGVGLTVFGGTVLRANAEMEDLQKTLSTVFGTAEKGQAAFKFINIFAQQTPFDIQTLTRAFIQLKGAGVEPTQELLTTLGNAASVTTNKLQAFEALVRITTRAVGGGLGLEELEQLVNQGIPVFKILEDRLNLTRLQVSEFGQTADGAAKIMAALNAEFNTTFAGAMADSSENLSVQMSNLGIAINNAFLQLGESGLNGQMKETIKVLTTATTKSSGLFYNFGVLLTRALRFVTDNFNQLVAGATAFITLKLAAAAIRAGVGFIQLSRAVLVASRAIAIAALTSKMGKAGLLGIAAAAGAAVVFNDKLKQAIDAVNLALQDTIGAGSEIADDLKNFFGLGEGQDIIELSAESLQKLERMFIDTAEAGNKLTTTSQNIDMLKNSVERLVKPNAELAREIEQLELAIENFKTNGLSPSEVEDFKKAIEMLKQEMAATNPFFEAQLSAIQNMSQGISDSFADMVMTGKFNLDSLRDVFSNFTKTMISKALELMVINRIMNSIFNLRGTSGELHEAPLPFTGKAGGGRIQGPTIVGERGPELFVPSSAGVIKNNMDTSNILGGGGGAVVNQVINIDAGVSQTVRAEMMTMLPMFKSSAMEAIIDSRRRGGQVATAFGA